MAYTFRVTNEADAYRAMRADHELINGSGAPLAHGVGNNMAYAFYRHNGNSLNYWSKGLPGCGAPADTKLHIYQW